MYEVFSEDNMCIGKQKTIEKAIEIAKKQPEDGVYAIKKDGKLIQIVVVTHLFIGIRKK